jgi:hypothetical protein
LDRRSATSVNRTCRLAAFAAAASLAALAAAGHARAAVTIGQLPPADPPPSSNCPSSSTDYLEPSVTSGNLYVAKEAGTITSWSTMASGPGADYVLKVFRRTPDPDVYQAVAHAPSHILSTGLNTFVVSVPVRSGDMVGFNTSGGPFNSCTFDVPGDTVLSRSNSLSDGTSGTFAPLADSRLNLSAVLAPSNDFTFSVSHDRRSGKALVTASTSNPGVVTLSGKGVKSGRAAKSVFVAGPVAFNVGATGKWRRKLVRTGRVAIGVTVTFAPTGGDPSSQSFTLRLRKKRTPVSL